MMSLVPMVGGKEKGELAKPLAKKLGVHPDELLQILPSGKTRSYSTIYISSRRSQHRNFL